MLHPHFIFVTPQRPAPRGSLQLMARQKQSAEDRAAHKAAVKAQKAALRLQRQGLGDEGLGRKECTLCSRPRDLLIRCQVDVSGAWHMACGKCWMQVSGGAVDGTPQHPHYRYGGLWKNHHANMSGKHKVPEGATAGVDASSSDSNRQQQSGTKRQQAELLQLLKDDVQSDHDESTASVEASSDEANG